MFTLTRTIYRSSLLEAPDLIHGFSTRLGGVSTLPHTQSMNVAFERGDGEETVRENLRLFLAAAKESEPEDDDLSRIVCGPQIHSASVRRVGKADGGQGVCRDVPYPVDGYLTDESGVWLLVRVADCVPILFCDKENGIIGACHAGWRGTAGGIAPITVEKMLSLGAEVENIQVAIGPCIHPCCYEVGGDFYEQVSSLRGEDFAKRHIKSFDNRMHANLTEMNKELLITAGVSEKNISISDKCTCCEPDLFHSHRATGGIRGTMAAVISL